MLLVVIIVQIKLVRCIITSHDRHNLGLSLKRCPELILEIIEGLFFLIERLLIRILRQLLPHYKVVIVVGRVEFGEA